MWMYSLGAIYTNKTVKQMSGMKLSGTNCGIARIDAVFFRSLQQISS